MDGLPALLTEGLDRVLGIGIELSIPGPALSDGVLAPLIR